MRMKLGCLCNWGIVIVLAFMNRVDPGSISIFTVAEDVQFLYSKIYKL